MKLGISPAAYMFTRGFIANKEDIAWRHEILDLPQRYYEPHPANFLEWFIKRAGYYHRKYGLYAIHMPYPDGVITPGKIVNDAQVQALKKKISRAGVKATLFAGGPGKPVLVSQEKFKTYMPMLRRRMEIAEGLGIQLWNFCAPGYTDSRFYGSTPLDRKMEIYARNLGLVLDEIRSYRLTPTIENHADFRVSEILEIRRRTNCDELWLHFDTGNPLISIEDPVDAAMLAAPFTVSVHLKDLKVIGPTYYGAKIVGGVLGKGSVDLPAILEILERNAPDPNQLSVHIEPMPLEGDEDEIVDESLRYCKRRLGHYLS